MVGHIDVFRRNRIRRLVQCGLDPKSIATDEHCSLATVYRYERASMMYGATHAPSLRSRGRPRRITEANGERLLEYLRSNDWATLDEQKTFLWEECDIEVDNATISRFLKRQRILLKIGERVSDRRD